VNPGGDDALFTSEPKESGLVAIPYYLASEQHPKRDLLRDTYVRGFKIGKLLYGELLQLFRV